MADDFDDEDDVLDQAPVGAFTRAQPSSIQKMLNKPRGMPVQDSTEISRILSLPRRAVVTEDSATARAMVEIAMDKYARKDVPAGACPCGCGFACKCATYDSRIAEINPKTGRTKRRCVTRLKWQQAWALHEMRVYGGLVASAPVGLGKCVDPNTEVFDYARGRRRIASESGGLRVASFDKTLNVRDATAFPSGIKPCVTVTLAEGTKLTTSTDHPILTTRGWIHAAELTTDDMVAVATAMPEPEVTTNASDDEVKFVAYMLSDGGCSQNQLHFTNANDSIISDWMSATRALGYDVSERPSKSRAREFSILKGRQRSKDGPGNFIAVEDRIRACWDLNGLAKDKRTHADVWGLPRRQVALFLNRFWACDGHVAKTMLEITLASEKLIDDLRFLLLRLGVRSRKAYKVASYVKDGERHYFDAWRITMCGDSAARFLDEVGDVLSKEDACRALRTKLASTKRNTNRDVVPIGPREVHEMCDELGLRPQKRGPGQSMGNEGRSYVQRWFGATKGQYISRNKFLEFCRRYNYHGKYSHLATTDVAWERVHEVLDVETREVYDLMVPGTHNFVANGVVIHNTLIDILAPLAFRDVRNALVMIPSSLRNQIKLEYLLVSEHFRVPNFVVHFPGNKAWPSEAQYLPDGRPAPYVQVVPYNFISSERRSKWIEDIAPDLICCDEVDALSDIESSRTMRVQRYYETNWQTTRFGGWTGSLTNAELEEMAHLFAMALRENSPLPQGEDGSEIVQDWGRCVDATDYPAPAGALKRFLEPGESEDNVRAAIARRIAETRGVIMIGGKQVIRTDAGEIVENDIRERPVPRIPPKVLEALAKARNNLRPDSLVSDDPDDIINDDLEKARVIRQVATGVFYVWNWNGIEDWLAREWLARRRDWNSELRETRLRGEVLLDSEKLCTDAARRAWGDLPSSPDLPEWPAESWPAWRDIMDRCKPTTEARWIDEWLVRDLAESARTTRQVFWYGMAEFADKLGKLAELPVFGDNSEKAFERELETRGDRSMICSVKAHGRGRNGLQFTYDAQTVINVLASARGWQQLLGRECRDGQQSAVVTTEVCLHTSELRDTLGTAIEKAHYVQVMTGEEQMLINGWRGHTHALDD